MLTSCYMSVECMLTSFTSVLALSSTSSETAMVDMHAGLYMLHSALLSTSEFRGPHTTDVDLVFAAVNSIECV